jgi:hypothetical protein
MERKYLHIRRIETSASAGCSVRTCIEDALLLAAEEKRTVTVEHNGHIFTISYDSIIDNIIHNVQPPCEIEEDQ